MIKLQKIYFAIYILILISFFSFVDIFFKNFYNYKLYLIYLILLSIIPYNIGFIKFKKEEFIKKILFLFSINLIIIAQYIFTFFREELVIYSIFLILIAFFMIFISFTKEPNYTGFYKIKKIYEFIFLFLIVIWAIFLRLYKINEIPAGIWFDEAQNGNEVINILNGEEGITVFIPRFTQMPSMFFYIASSLCKIFGIEIFSLRLVSILSGTLSIIGFYFLLKIIFKDIRYALLGAFLMASLRWHITFSRIAFLGMLSVCLLIIFFYFYLKAYEEKRKDCSLFSGISLGLSFYSFTIPYFSIIFIFFHNLILFFKDKRVFLNKYFVIFLIFLIMFITTASSILIYATKNFDEFTQRAKDVSILNDIKRENSVRPIFLNLYRYFLTFNFAGDYNGRHNLYKKPLLDEISGVFFILGLIISLIRQNFRKFFFLFFIFLLPGILTINIEAPQAYRIIGAIPFVCILILIAIKEIENLLLKIDLKEKQINIFFIVLAISIAVINYNQYFVLYPKEKASYMDFSPEANSIGNFILKNSKEYYILVSQAKNMYGFYYWEQRQILNFMTYNKANFDYMEDYNKITLDKLIEKKGVCLILRPSDENYIKRVEIEYPENKKMEFLNPFNGEVMFTAYFIDSDKIRKSKEADYIIYKP